jgi:signal peptide peptidase SppA
MSTPIAEPKRYPNVVRAVLEMPWAILPSTLRAIVEVVVLRVHGEALSDDEIQARIGSGPARRDLRMVGATAVIPVYGVIAPRADAMSEMSGGTSVQRLRSSFLEAVDDKDVSSIVLDVDSPGGQTDLITELAADIRGARGSKPIVAVANTRAASAAYWIASQADEFVVTPSGSVGSIGVFAAHEDISKAEELVGVKTTLIAAGKYKTEASPFEPLSDEARAYIQGRVDDAYAQFTSDVAKGRRVAVDTVRSGYGEGRMLTPKRALKEGMVDRIEAMESVLDRLTATAVPQKRRRAQSTSGGDSFIVGPIASHKTATTDEAWDGPANKARLRNDGDEAYYRSAYAWQDDDSDPNTKAAYKFIHHQVADGGDVGAANLNGCSAGIAVLNGGRGGTKIPNEDRQGVYNHLSRHLKDGGREPPPLKSVEIDESQAAMSGLSFAARLRGTLRVLEEHLEHARSFADVRERDHLTGPKREQFAAVTEALRDLVAVEAGIRQLLADTDPEKPAEEARLAALAYMARRNRERGDDR